jgi:fused signal recognition particle receptor
VRKWFTRNKKEQVPAEDAQTGSEAAAQVAEAPSADSAAPTTTETATADMTGAETAAEQPKGLFRRLVQGLSKSRAGFVDRISQVLTRRGAIDEELYDELEEVLIQADVSVSTATALVDEVRKRVKSEHITQTDEVEPILRAEMVRLLESVAQPLTQPKKGELTVFLVVGVNGAGKTTTIGKLAARYKAAGLQVLLGAADTFRAAAIEQLEVWSERAQVGLIKHQEGSDPAAVAFDSIRAARARNADVVIIDTAGRLQTKTHLMQELAKINRVVERELGRKADETLLVLDATTGQNGLSQARLFSEATPVSGVALTKLDGTARGGIILSVTDELKLPVKLIGIGEGIDDLRDFDAASFVAALFHRSDQ